MIRLALRRELFVICIVVLSCIVAVASMRVFGLQGERDVIERLRPRLVGYAENRGLIGQLAGPLRCIGVSAGYYSQVCGLSFDEDLSITALRELSRLTALESLSILRGDITKDKIDALSHCTALRRLGLFDSTVSDDALRGLVLFDDLRELSVSGKSVTDKSMAGLCAPISLIAIEVWCPEDSPDELSRMDVRPLTLAPNLRRLEFHSPGVGDNTIRQLADAYSRGRVRHLEELHLSFAAVGNTAIDELATISSLRIISLDGTSVTAEGRKRIAMLLEHNAMRSEK